MKLIRKKPGAMRNGVGDFDHTESQIGFRLPWSNIIRSGRQAGRHLLAMRVAVSSSDSMR